MRATRCWASPAILLVLAVGCGQGSPQSKNGPGAEPTRAGVTPAFTDGNLVTLKVEGMV